MLNNKFCEMNILNKLPKGGGSVGNGGTVLISCWKCNYSIYLDIQVYYLDPSNIHTCMPRVDIGGY